MLALPLNNAVLTMICIFLKKGLFAIKHMLLYVKNLHTFVAQTMHGAGKLTGTRSGSKGFLYYVFSVRTKQMTGTGNEWVP